MEELTRMLMKVRKNRLMTYLPLSHNFSTFFSFKPYFLILLIRIRSSYLWVMDSILYLRMKLIDLSFRGNKVIER